MDIWHDISPGEKAPEIVNMITEVPKDCKVKYELDKETGLLRVDRFLYSAVHYPGNYGFIPGTLAEDNDPLDVLALSPLPVYPLSISKVKVIGMIKMSDDKGKDDKIIAVHLHDPRYSEWDSLKDVPKHFLLEIQDFFQIYKKLQGKKVKVYNIAGKREAFALIKKAIERFKR